MTAPVRLRRLHGVTLVELMVALTIGLVLALAAATLYLATQETARSTRSFSDINETGKFALDTIGRELEKAGFYPAEFETAMTGAAASEKQTGQYLNIKNPGAGASVAFDQGIFGCTGARFDPSIPGCAAKDPAEPSDSVVVNYFVTGEFGGGAVIGNINDCNRRPASGDVANAARLLSGLPLLVSNRFALVAKTLRQPDGSSVATHVLGCNANGRTGAPAADTDATYQPLLQGIDDMTIGYGVYTPGATSQSPTRFYKADDIASLGPTAWQRVTAVRVCLVVRSIENARLEDKSGSARLKPSCRPENAPTALPASDHYLYRKFEQVFAVRNNLTGLL